MGQSNRNEGIYMGGIKNFLTKLLCTSDSIQIRKFLFFLQVKKCYYPSKDYNIL
jgi:hypothetical protein